MTDTQATDPRITGPQPATIGMAVGQAEAVLSKLLARVLAETGTSRKDYLALQRLASLGGTATREAYIFDLSDALEIDLWAAGELADALAESGILDEADGTIRLGGRGQDLRGRIAGSAGALTRALLAPVSPADVETTVRTLHEVTRRGRDLLAIGAEDFAVLVQTRKGSSSLRRCPPRWRRRLLPCGRPARPRARPPCGRRCSRRRA